MPRTKSDGTAGTRVLAFLDASAALAAECAVDFGAIPFADPAARAYAEALTAVAGEIEREVGDAKRALGDLDGEQLARLDEAVVAGAVEALTAARELGGEEAKYRATEKGTALGDLGSSVAQKVLDKIVEAIPGPAGAVVGGIVADLGKLLEALGVTVAEAAGMSEAERQLEEKLDTIGRILYPDFAPGMEVPPERVVKTEIELLERLVTERSGVIEDILTRLIIAKIDRLAELLGKTLVAGYDGIEDEVTDSGWIVEPRTIPRGAKFTPDRSIKVELDQILSILIRLLNPPPPEELERPVGLAAAKKIYVYEEGVFRPRGASDARAIDVQTPAFDLSGWIDLSALGARDSVRVRIGAALAGEPRAEFSDITFAGAQRPPLKPFADFARGIPQLVGTDVRVTITQPASGTGFRPRLRIPYQFVVESQS